MSLVEFTEWIIAIIAIGVLTGWFWAYEIRTYQIWRGRL